jgi:hypothetical protein
MAEANHGGRCSADTRSLSRVSASDAFAADWWLTGGAPTRIMSLGPQAFYSGSFCSPSMISSTEACGAVVPGWPPPRLTL